MSEEGYSVVRHDEYDEQAYQGTLEMYPKLRETVRAMGYRFPIAPAFVEDMFYSVFQADPKLRDAEDLLPSATVNRTILEQIMQTAEWQNVRNAGTVGDQLYSAIATSTVARSVLSSLDKEILKRLQDLHDAETEAAQLFAKAETLEELAQQRPERAKELYAQAQEAKAQAEQQQRQAEQVGQDLEADGEKIEDAARQSARNALDQSEIDIQSSEAAMKTFTQGYGSGSGQGGTSSALTIKEKLSLANKVGQSERLKQIAELCGRMTRIALQTQKSKIKHPPDEITGITIGDDLAKMRPVETALLADPVLEDLFYKKYADKALMQLDMRGSEKQGRGPVIVALDSSGSMHTGLGTNATREAWSKAVMLALLAIARKQKRDFAVLHFSSRGQMKVFEFLKGEAKPSELIAATEFFYGGLTDYETWMQTALKLVESSKFSKADVICVSDGDVTIPDALEKDWNRRRKAKDMRCYSVLLGSDYGKEALGRISDGFATVDNMRQDTTALEMMFSI